MTIITSREQRRQLERENAKLPVELVELLRSSWPEQVPHGLVRVWRSRHFLVQEYAPEVHFGPSRLSISKTSINSETARWEDGISWEDLQRLKREAGYGDVDAVEVFPKDRDIVNVANMRHLFLMTEPLSFAWRKK